MVEQDRPGVADPDDAGVLRRAEHRGIERRRRRRRGQRRLEQLRLRGLGELPESSPDEYAHIFGERQLLIVAGDPVRRALPARVPGPRTDCRPSPGGFAGRHPR